MLENSTAHLMADDVLSCKHCQRGTVTSTGVAVGVRNSQKAVVYVNRDDPDCCPRCGKRVYFAEQILSLGRKWHRPCFTCCKLSSIISVSQHTDSDALFAVGCIGLFGSQLSCNCCCWVSLFNLQSKHLQAIWVLVEMCLNCNLLMSDSALMLTMCALQVLVLSYIL